MEQIQPNYFIAQKVKDIQDASGSLVAGSLIKCLDDGNGNTTFYTALNSKEVMVADYLASGDFELLAKLINIYNKNNP